MQNAHNDNTVLSQSFSAATQESQAEAPAGITALPSDLLTLVSGGDSVLFWG